MDLQPISTKQLRRELPLIKEKLLMGQSFYWIDRSRPVGVIQPLPQKQKSVQSPKQKIMEYEQLVEKIAGGINSKIPLTPVQLNRILDERYEKI